MTASELDEDAAARWAVLRDAGPLAAEEQRALDAWLAADERRHGALLRAEATLAYLDRGRALKDLSPPAEPEPTRYRRRAVLIGGAASGLVAAGLGGFFLLAPAATELHTVVGEVRRVPLADGSFASLNTNSRVAVSIGDDRRRIQLEDGEAWFQVAHDARRPFVVEVGDVRIRAVGTAFSVRRLEGGANVLVTEGVVEAWVAGHESQRERIAAGARSFVAENAAPIEVVQAPEAVDRALAWRVGEIALNGESLAYAVAEINRYNARQLAIGDAALGREPLVGYFRTNEPENFARAVSSMIGGRVVEEGQVIRLVR